MSSDGSGQVKVKFNADGTRMENVIVRLQGKLSQLQSEMARMKKGQQQMEAASTSNFRSMISSAQKAVGSLGAVARMVDRVNQAIDEQRRVLRDAASDSLDLAKSQQAVITNLGSQVSQQSKANFLKELDVLAKREGIEPSVITREASELISSMAGEPNVRMKKALRTIEAVAPFHRFNPDEMGEFGGAVQGVRQSLPARVTEKQAMGFMFELASQARIENAERLTEFAPAFAAVDVTSGGDRIENVIATGAMLAAMGSRAQDAGGAETTTALSNLAANLRREDFIKTSLGPDASFADRIRFVQETAQSGDHDEEIDAIISRLKGKGPMKPIQEEVLRGVGKSARLYREAFNSLDLDSGTVDSLKNELETTTPALINANAMSKNRVATHASRQRKATVSAVHNMLYDARNGVFSSSTRDGLGIVDSLLDPLREKAFVASSRPLETAVGQLEAVMQTADPDSQRFKRVQDAITLFEKMVQGHQEANDELRTLRAEIQGLRYELSHATSEAGTKQRSAAASAQPGRNQENQ